MSQLGPGELLNFVSRGDTQKTGILAGDPQIAGGVFDNGTYNSAWYTAYGKKMAALQVSDPAERRDPDSPAIILKKSVRVEPVELAIPPATGCARNDYSPVRPSI